MREKRKKRVQGIKVRGERKWKSAGKKSESGKEIFVKVEKVR